MLFHLYHYFFLFCPGWISYSIYMFVYVLYYVSDYCFKVGPWNLLSWFVASSLVSSAVGWEFKQVPQRIPLPKFFAFLCHVLNVVADGCVPQFSFSPVFHHFNVFNFMWVFLVSYSHSYLCSLLLFRGEDSCSNMQWFDPIVLIHSLTLIIFRYYDTRVFLEKYNLFFSILS